MSQSGAGTAIAPILVVDDDASLRRTMHQILVSDGYGVIDAADGVEAAALCEAAVPSLIVVDAQMPRMDGFALCRSLRRRPASAHVPILMMTGLNDRESITAAYDAGATDFIAKPFDWLIFSHRIRYMLRTAEMVEAVRQSEGRLRVAKDAAEAADRAKTDFLANMSHELRTPLSAIIGFAAVMRDGLHGKLDPRYAECAQIINDSGLHLLAMIDDILAMAQTARGELPYVEETVRVADIVALSLDIVRPMAQQGGVTCHIEIAPGVETMHGDPGKLRRVLINLLTNAVKFTEPGGSVWLRARREADGTMALSVADTGIGIPPDKMELVMQPFGQVDSSPSRRHQGVGLGLPLAKRLVELHGGTMAIASTPGKGTIVTVRFPG